MGTGHSLGRIWRRFGRLTTAAESAVQLGQHENPEGGGEADVRLTGGVDFGSEGVKGLATPAGDVAKAIPERGFE